MESNAKWESFQSQNEILYRLHFESQVGYTFQWTNLSSVFEEKLETTKVREKWKLMNKAVEIDDVDEIVITIQNGLNNACDIKQDNSSGTLDISFKDDALDILLKWQFDCKLDPFGIEDLLKDTLLTCNYLMEEQDNLIKVIHSKDEELKDLYLNGASLMNSSLHTSPFKNDGHVHKFCPNAAGCLSSQNYRKKLLKAKELLNKPKFFNPQEVEAPKEDNEKPVPVPEIAAVVKRVAKRISPLSPPKKKLTSEQLKKLKRF